MAPAPGTSSCDARLMASGSIGRRQPKKRRIACRSRPGSHRATRPGLESFGYFDRMRGDTHPILPRPATPERASLALPRTSLRCAGEGCARTAAARAFRLLVSAPDLPVGLSERRFGFSEDGKMPVICPTSQIIFARSRRPSTVKFPCRLLCMGLFSIFWVRGPTNPARRSAACTGAASERGGRMRLARRGLTCSGELCR